MLSNIRIVLDVAIVILVLSPLINAGRKKIVYVLFFALFLMHGVFYYVFYDIDLLEMLRRSVIIMASIIFVAYAHAWAIRKYTSHRP